MCQSITKYLLFGFNFIFWLAGAACLGVGIWLQVDSTVQDTIEIAGMEIFYTGAYILIAAGCVMLVVGFFGCCGAIKESKCLLGTYFVFLFILFGVQVGVGIWALVEYDSFDDVVTASMEKLQETLPDASDDNAFIAIEQNLKCCGTTHGCTDWDENNVGSMGCGCDPTDDNNGNCTEIGDFPSNRGCKPDPLSPYEEQYPNHVYNTPCDQAIVQFIEDNFVIVGAILLAIGLAEIIGMMFAMSLCCSIKD